MRAQLEQEVEGPLSRALMLMKVPSDCEDERLISVVVIPL